MKKRFLLPLITILLSSSGLASTTVNVCASNTTDIATSSMGKVNKTWTKKLSQAGYVYHLTSSGTLNEYVDGIFKPNYSKKKLKEIVTQKINFKVTAVRSLHNNNLVYLVSSGNKYHGWTSIVSSIKNKDAQCKGLKPLVKIEKKVMNTKNKQKNKKLLEQAEKIANNLSGYNKKIGKTSVKQLRQWVNKRDIANIPALLVGLAI